METDIFVYFVNFLESDENGQVKMYRKSPKENRLQLVSDNYFAFTGIMDDFREGNETWMSKRMEKERKLYLDEQVLPLVKEYLAISDKGYPSVHSKEGERFHYLEQEIDEQYVSLPEMDVAAFLKDKFSL